MTLSESQRRNLIVKFRLENLNKNRSETVEHFKLELQITNIFRAIERFEKHEKVERKFGYGKKCGHSSSALKKQTTGRSAISYRE
jgi:hypothetical protein